MTEVFTPHDHKYDSAAQHPYLDNDGLIVTPAGEHFWLSNRHWEEINGSLGELPGLAIDHKLQTTPDDYVVRVLDVGAGARGSAMFGLQEKFANARRKPLITGVDLTSVADGVLPHNKVVADATHLPFSDGTIDIAYSHQSLALMGDLSVDENRRLPLQSAVNEVVRVLRPGGFFVIDFDLLYERDFAEQNDLKALHIPEGVQTFWGHRGPRGEKRLGNFLLTAIIKDDPATTDSLIWALGLKPGRRIDGRG